MIDSIVDHWSRGCAGFVSSCCRRRAKMASSENQKASLEQWPAKPLHGRGSVSIRSELQTHGRRSTPAAPGAEVRGWTAFRRPVSSDEGESQKAGAEQGDPTRSQGKEAVRNEISISHDTPSDSNAVPN
jgi:hypothetical protein